MAEKKKVKRKRKWTWLRYRKGDHAHNLFYAAQHWIHENGGTAVVLSGISLMDQGAGRYQVCIGALGKMPEKKQKSGPAGKRPK
jgi:hypothetical protein